MPSRTRRSGTIATENNAIPRTEIAAEPVPPVGFAAPPEAAIADTAAVASQPVAALPAGSVDAVTGNEVIGWAWDPERPEEPVTVEASDGATVFARVVADLYRPDLEAAGIG